MIGGCDPGLKRDVQIRQRDSRCRDTLHAPPSPTSHTSALSSYNDAEAAIERIVRLDRRVR